MVTYKEFCKRKDLYKKPDQLLEEIFISLNVYYLETCDQRKYTFRWWCNFFRACKSLVSYRVKYGVLLLNEYYRLKRFIIVD